MTDPDDLVRAAGGIVWRGAPDGSIEVVIVHRGRYDDWTFPKGKLDPGETWEDAALREVHEETGLRCTLGRELGSIEYVDNRGRPKRARYWEMSVVDDTGFHPNEEIGACEWVPIDQVRARLSYRRDVDVLDSFVGPAT